MSVESFPFLPLPYDSVKGIIHGFYPVSSKLIKFFPSLDLDLEATKSRFSGKEYLGAALFTFTIYFLATGSIITMWAYRNDMLSDPKTRIIILTISFVFSILIFFYTMMHPKWAATKRIQELDKNLLFAARHLMIQTTAGVQLFESIVSISEEYENSFFNYGAISKEFKVIVKEVRGGKELTQALEDSAVRNPSPYYRRVLWQLANANKAGANIGYVLRDVVEFLSNDQRIMIREYGSQLNPLALFYMFTCVIAPTMGLIFLAITTIISSIPVNEAMFIAILMFLGVFQMMFIGLIKSRRPVVAI